MSHDTQDPRDDRLDAALREAVRTGRAPEAWVRDALEIPRRAGTRRPVPGRPAGRGRPAGASTGLGRGPGVSAGPRRAPWLTVLFPHLAGLGLLCGLALVWILRPELLRAALDPVVIALRGMTVESVSGFWTLAGLLAPLGILFIDQIARGFPMLRRLHLLH